MPTIACRLDTQTYLKLQKYLKDNHTTISEFLKSIIQEKLVGDILGFSTVDWKVNAANLLGITVGQLSHAFSFGETASEVFARLSSKSDLFDFLPITNNEFVGVQVTYGKNIFIVSTARSSSKIDMVQKLLKQIEDKSLEGFDNLL